jgi:hypothetical protein
MSALPMGQSAILNGGYSAWQAPLAAIFSGIGAAGQPGGWNNFSQGVQGGLQNFQQGQRAMMQDQRAQEQFQMQQEEFADRQRRANQEEAQREATIDSLNNLLSPPQPATGAQGGQPVAAMFGGTPPQPAPNQSALFGEYAGIPPHARQSAILSGYPDAVVKRGMEPDGTINLNKAGEGGIGAGAGPSTVAPNDGSQLAGGMNILGRDYTADQVAALRSMAANDPDGVMKILQEGAFAEPKDRRTMEIAGRLVDADTGDIIRDLSAEEIALRQASRPQTILNMPGDPTPDEQGAAEFAKANAKGQAEYFGNVATAGANAARSMGDIDQLTKLIEVTPQGSGQEWLNQGAGVLARMGIDPGEFANLPASQAFQSIVSRITPTLRVPGSGASSDLDVKMFMQSLPALANTPDGNRIIASNMRKLAERSIKEAEIAYQVQNGDLKPAQGRKAIQDLGPLNLDLPKNLVAAPAPAPTAAPAQTDGDIPTVSTPAEAGKLPKGTKFRDPNGVIRVVP